MAERKELLDAELESIVGGTIEHTWDNDSASGELWMVTRQTQVKYTFTNHHVIDYITKLQSERWDDGSILQDLISRELITEV